MLISVVIPCYNPAPFLHETLASVRAQTYQPVEIIIVNDGSDQPEARALLQSVAPTVTRYIEQENRGLGGARNTGFRAARGDYVLPLDADDRIAPSFLAECMESLRARPDAAFVYTDCRVFGDTEYIERFLDYNLHWLLEQNTLCYASLIRRADWELAGGYDESMRLGYEDWDFWLRLAERGRFGWRCPKPLFEYRKHGRTLLSVAREHHEQIVAHIQASHPQLYSREGRIQIKARWAPAVCVLGPELGAEQTIGDWQRLPTTDVQMALEQSDAEAFLIPSSASTPDPHAAELCALSVWSGNGALRLPDGSMAVARSALRLALSVDELERWAKPRREPVVQRPSPIPGWMPWSSRLERVRRHLVNAELASLQPWRQHPLRTMSRLVPLRLKERVNRAAGRPVFDLSFYLRFNPRSVLINDALVEPLRYLPREKGRRRVAFVTPHLDPGGAESVLLEVARALDRRQWEIFLLATQSEDSRWRARWELAADHVYDLAPLAPPDRLIAALYSMSVNWEFDAVLIQNSLAGYSAIPHLRRALAAVKIIDLVHAVDPNWDFVSATRAVAGQIDLRVAISGAGRQRLLEAGVAPEKIRLIRNGIDLERFRATPPAGSGQILFAGRLDPVKRPLLLVEIAAELARLRPQKDFRFVVAGDGPEAEALRRRAEPTGLFTLLGMVDDVAPLLAGADVVVVPSKAEGIPLIALEAMAVGRPVVCARAGAAPEAVDDILIDPGPSEAARFAAAIHELLNHPERRREMGARGRLKVEAEYSLERARQAYRDLFCDTLKR